MILLRSIRRFSLLCGFVLPALLCADRISPSEVEIAGDIDYGQTSAPIPYTSSPKYRALVFTAEGGDRIEVTVRSDAGAPVVAIADGTLLPLATGGAKLVHELPDKGPDAEAYYIVLREAEGKPAKFTVTLKKVG